MSIINDSPRISTDTLKSKLDLSEIQGRMETIQTVVVLSIEQGAVDFKKFVFLRCLWTTSRNLKKKRRKEIQGSAEKLIG